jgi:hypothetical protein
MITCKLTGKVGQAIKAHIVPRAFYELPPQEEGPCVLVSNALNTFPKKVPVGIYDETMVTQDGENLFKPWDDYAIRILLKEKDAFEPRIDGDKVIGWTLSEYEYSPLKLFALSILWRAHTSTRREFAKVQLGPHEPIIKGFLLNKEPGTPEEYSVIIVKWIDEGFGAVFMDPFPETYERANFYRIYCGRYILYIKVDQRLTCRDFRPMQLGANNQLFVRARELKTSKEWPLMQKLVLESVT